MFKKFLKTILLIDLFQGLWVTLKYTLSGKVTIQYPEKVKEPSQRFRGILRLYKDENGEPLCIACKMCQRSCPEHCFDVEGARNEAGKMRPVSFGWRMMRCTFCGLCVEACPTDAIRFSREFRMAALDAKKYFFTYDMMYEDFDIQKHFLEEPEDK